VSDAGRHWVQVLNSFVPVRGGWEGEHRFELKRKWRFDFAAVSVRIAIEVEGGAWTHGRHTRGRGFVADLEKYNRAVVLGWRVLRYTPSQMSGGAFVRDVQALLSVSDAI
jgi:very-short-patch-repair endonuclease